VSVVAACTGGSNKPLTTTSVTTAPAPTFNQGGSITVAAEGEPGCMDWISTCAGSTWGVWTVETNTMPRAYDFTSDGEYKPSILLTGEAAVRMTPEQVVTYHLNPRASWSDGQPITSQDFQYTWDQIAHGQGIADQSGYSDIVSVDDSDPLTAVVTFSQPYADWRKLFGGTDGILPSHLLEGQDRDALMKDGYTWSGGPWELPPGGWIRGESITLVPNPNYWGKKPDLGSVTFRIFTDPTAELQAYAAGQVLAAYPTPEAAVAGYRGVAGTLLSLTGGLDFDALWFNVAAAPVDAKAVRQAVAYTLDRQTIASALLGALEPTAQPLQSLLTPAYGAYYNAAFARYKPDPAMVNQLMTGAGWARNKAGFWAMGATRAEVATIDLKVPSTSPGAEAAANVIGAELQGAGFQVTIAPPETPGQLFTQDLPAGAFSVALYPVDLERELPSGTPTTVGVPGIDDNDPGQCQLFCSASIPTAATGGVGDNYVRLADSTLDRYLEDLDSNANSDDRVADAAQAATILADDLPALPLVTLPDVLVVNTNMIGVEGGTFNHNLAYGPYGELNEWYLK